LVHPHSRRQQLPRQLATNKGSRSATPFYLRQIAEAVDGLGFGGALLPTGRSCEDAWVVASSLATVARRMKFLVAVRPGLISPTVSARMALSLDRMSGGRCLINVVTGGDPTELAGEGLQLDHDARYEITLETLTTASESMAFPLPRGLREKVEP